MSQQMEELKVQLAELRTGASAQWAAVSAKKAELREAEDEHKRARGQVEALEDYINELDGVERNCRGHRYVAEPSGRGVGFDDRCIRCGHFRTAHPVY